MNQFEDQLKQVLARKVPSTDFADKVFSKIHRQQHPSGWVAMKWVTMKWAPVFRMAAGLAACLAAVGVYETYRYQQGQFAKQQVMLALRITADKTQIAQQKLDQLNHRSFLP